MSGRHATALLQHLGETGTADNLDVYLNAFSDDAREIFEHFRFTEFIHRLDEANLLYLVFKRFANRDPSSGPRPSAAAGLVMPA